MRRFNKISGAVLTATMMLSLAGCGGSSSEPAAAGTAAESAAPVAATTDTMNIELTTAPVGIHPLKTNDAPSTYVNAAIYETLYNRSFDGTSYEPCLAADFPQSSDDGLTVTIPLREGVTFSDGTPFTADAVAYMIDCLKDENYGSQRPSIVASIESYEVTDEHTITLHLAYDDGVLVAKLAHTNGAIVNPAADKAQDLLVDPTGAGTGPYAFVSAVAGSSYDLDAREDYWGGAPEVKHLHYDIIGDEATAVARLQTGESDFYPTVAADSYPTVAAIPGITACNQESGAIQYLMLRSHADSAANPLMENVEFRKAIIQAIDIPTYVDSVLTGTATLSKSIVPSSLVCYSKEMEDSYISYDADAAKATIDENGWAGQTITMLVSTREAQQTLAAYVQAELAKVGITVNVVSEEWATFLADAKEDKSFDVSVMSWSNVTGDGQQMLEPNFSTKNGVRIKYNNAEFDAYVEACAETTDAAARTEALTKAVTMIQSEAVVQPMYVVNTMYAYNSTKFANVKLGMSTTLHPAEFQLAK